MQETSTKQRELKNVSYNYLVESCVDPIKSKTVLTMMNETLQEDFDTLDDVYKNSEYEDKIIEGILLNTTATFATRFMEAHQRNSELTKKTVIENYSKIVKDNSMRREFWLLVSRYRQTRSQYHQDYYSDLLYSKNFIDLYTEIINKDIERTKGTNEEKQIMRNILKAYARRNSKVGYVQGHNFIIRLVLELITDEEEAFWTYCYIVEECFSVSYFMNLKSLMLDSLIFRILLKAVEPKLAVHLQKIYDFDLDLVTFKWFLSLYTDSSLPRDYIHKIYDLLVLGDKLVYLKAGFVILSEIGSKLLKCKEISDVYQVIDSMNQHIKISADKFIEKVNKIYINERILEIIKISNQHKIQKANQLMKEQPGYKEPRKGRGIPPPQCRTGILICTEREQPKGPELDSFTFSCKNIIKNKINDYFSDHHGFWEENKRRHRVKQRETDIMLHRTKHVCAKTQMHANFRYLEAELLTTDYYLQDLKKDIRTTFPIIYDEIRKAEQLEHDHYEGMEAKSFEEEETKTLPRASSRMYKLNTTSWSQMKKGYAADI